MRASAPEVHSIGASMMDLSGWEAAFSESSFHAGLKALLHPKAALYAPNNTEPAGRYNRHLMNRIMCMLSCAVLLAGSLLSVVSGQSNPQATPAPAAPQAVPAIDGAAGPCSVEFTVTTADGKPAEAATVKVHIAYGFGGFHKLDLQAGTNADGKVKFTGLPSRVRRSLLEFEASKDQLVGTTTYDPATECQGKREIKLGKANAAGI